VARKTIKGLEEIIEDLEKSLNEQLKINIGLNKTISKMQYKANDSFYNSTDYKRMDKEIEYLTTVIKVHEITIKGKEDSIKRNMNTIQQLLNENEALKEELKKLRVNQVNKLKNERGAGRKEIFNEEQKARVKMLRLQGKSYRAIAKDMNCSVATVHKIINEQQC